MSSEDTNIWERIGRIPRSVFGIVTFILVLVPLISPLGLPMPVPEPALRYYEVIDQMPAGSVILISSASSGMAYDEAKPQMKSTIDLIFTRSQDLKVVFYSLVPEQVPLMINDFNLANPEKYGAVYGEDYVYLGYIAGEEAAEAALAANIWETVPVDYYGNPLSELPMMTDIHDHSDIDIYIIFHSSATDHERAIRQWNSAHGVRMLDATPSGTIPSLLPYYPEPLEGYLGGVTGAAGLELLIGIPGDGLRMTDMKNLGMLPMIALLILGNVSYYGMKYLGKKELN